jgi:hypothetical protein
MTATPVCSNAGAIAALNALLALLNTGGAGSICIFTGSPEATCETADSGTLLATLALSSTSFPTAVDNGSGGATATANSITSASAGNSGTAGHFRAKSGAGTVILQGTVGTSSADMILSSTTITSGQTVSITSWTVTLPDGSGTD